MITASSLARLRACPSSAALQRAETYNEWADLGHDAHEELADLANLEPRLAQYVPPGARVEVKFAYDVATGAARIIGEGGGRNYGVIGPTEIAGSCDVLGVEFGRVVIVDWKTGFADVEPARSNAQLWFYALAACRALGLHAAVVRIVYTQSGRCDEYEIDCGEHASAFADAAITASTSKAAITRAAKQVGQPSLAKTVIARARELGGVAAEQRMPIGEYLASEYAPAKLGAVDLGELNRALAEATP